MWNKIQIFIYAYAYAYTMVKVVSLSNKAYENLKSLKGERESFSDVVLKIVNRERKTSLLEFAGVWKDLPEIDRIFENVVKDRSKASDRKIDLKW